MEDEIKDETVGLSRALSWTDAGHLKYDPKWVHLDSRGESTNPSSCTAGNRGDLELP